MGGGNNLNHELVKTLHTKKYAPLPTIAPPSTGQATRKLGRPFGFFLLLLLLSFVAARRKENVNEPRLSFPQINLPTKVAATERKKQRKQCIFFPRCVLLRTTSNGEKEWNMKGERQSNTTTNCPPHSLAEV